MGSRRLMEYVSYLRKKRIEDKLYLRWIMGPQYEVSFDEFKRSLTPQRVRSDEEIMKDLEEAYKKAGLV